MERRYNPSQEEFEKYDQIWKLPAYRVRSHSEEMADQIFMEITGAQPGETVVDVGCGTGRGGLALEKQGLKPTFWDITNKGLSPEVWRRSLQSNRHHIIISPIWYPLKPDNFGMMRPFAFDYALCADVMEHVPIEYTMAAVSNIMRHIRKGAFFKIAFYDESFQQYVGKPLHMTVMPFEWWRDRLPEFGKLTEARHLVNADNHQVQEGIFYLETK